MKIFKKLRPRDIDLEIPVSDERNYLTFYIFNEPALNTFDKELAQERSEKGNYRIIKQVELETQTLEKILDKYLPKEQKIDFMSVDVEGSDFKVLKSNNWEKYRPKVVLVEILSSSLEDLMNSEVVKFMKNKGYVLFAKTFNTVFFVENDFKKEINIQ